MRTTRLKNLIISKLYKPPSKKKEGLSPGEAIGRIDHEIDKTVSRLTAPFRNKK